MTHKIKRVTPKSVEFDPALPGRNPVRSLKPEKFGVTDPAIGLVVGNEFEKGAASQEITGFGTELVPDTGPRPRVDDNPYNFVALASRQPWHYQPNPDLKSNPEAKPYGHEQFKELTGFIEFKATALTPCFVPEGFPVAEGDAKPKGGEYSDDDLRQAERYFCRMLDHAKLKRYVIPGASFKGALRNAIEALSNSRFAIVDKKLQDSAHLYRRRVFTPGILIGPPLPNGDWMVEQIELPPDLNGTGTIENKAGLLAYYRAGKPRQKGMIPLGITFTLSQTLAKGYAENIKSHPHYMDHYKDHGGEYDWTATGARPDWRVELAELHAGDVVYFTANPSSRKITNFGKNVNYLWPAQSSLLDLCRNFIPREKPRLDSETDMAEYLFGFAGDHDNIGTHPFRGHLRFETLWGPETAQAERIELAPLTAPQSKGKSRPLYLAPGADGLSASFDDPACEIRGRKFYWHQRYEDGRQIWPKHTRNGTSSVDQEFRREVIRQCPPPIHALPPQTEFTGRIHFSNLPASALGAILFALEGDGSYDHAIHLGKGKPRGLGSFRIEVRYIKAWRIKDRYASLAAEPKGMVDLAAKRGAILVPFRDWCAFQARKPQGTRLAEHPHIQDFIRLHTWPGRNSIRYYPVNFSQYSWLPGDNDARGEPKKPRQRPPAMKRARDLKP